MSDIIEHKNPVADEIVSSFRGVKRENIAGCKQALDKAIDLFVFSESLKQNIRRPKPGELAYSPCTLEQLYAFVVLNDAKLKVYAPLIYIIIAQTLSYMTTRDSYSGNPILFCLDEFASYGKMNIANALRKLRKNRIRITLLTQSIADIDLVYGRDERKVMIDNCAFTAILGCDDPETQEFFSKKIGEKTVIKSRISKSERPVEKTVNLKYLGERTLYDTEVTMTTQYYDCTERIVPPAELGRLVDELILLAPDGHLRLTKNFSFSQ